MANACTETAKGTIAFVAGDDQYMFGLKRDVRFIDASGFHIDGPKMFYGFLCGMAAQDFDLELYLCGWLPQDRPAPLETLENMFKELEAFSARSGIHIVLSINGRCHATLNT